MYSELLRAPLTIGLVGGLAAIGYDFAVLATTLALPLFEEEMTGWRRNLTSNDNGV